MSARRSPRWLLAAAALVAALCAAAPLLAAAADDSALVGGSSGKAAPSHTEVALPLEHALGLDAPWTRAGTFTARANFDKRGSGAVRFSHVKLTREPLSAEDRRATQCVHNALLTPSDAFLRAAATYSAAMRKLLAANGRYRVRTPAHALTPDVAAAAGRYVATFLPLRCMVEAGLAEHYVLNVDEAGRVYGLELVPAGGACAPAEGPAPAAPAAWTFRSTAAVRLPKDAPPLASTAALRMDADAIDAAAEAGEAPGAADELAQKPPERSFLSKYGMMIAVLVFNLVFRALTGAGAEPPRGEGGSGGGGSGRAAAGAKRD